MTGSRNSGISRAAGTTARQAVRCAKRRLLAVAKTRAQGRPQSVGADQRDALLVTHATCCTRLHGDAVLMDREVLNAGAEAQRDVGALLDRGGEHRLQVGAMDHPVGRAVALLGACAQAEPARSHGPTGP